MGSSTVGQRVASPAVTTDSSAPAEPTTPLDVVSKPVKIVLTELAAWVPSEALGIYALGFGTLAPKAGPDQSALVTDRPANSADTSSVAVPSSSDQLQLFWVVFVTSIIILIFQAWRVRRDATRPAGKRGVANWKPSFFGRLALSVLLSTVALVLYISNIPGNPFVDPFGPIDADWAPIYAAIAAAVIPITANLAGIGKPEGE